MRRAVVLISGGLDSTTVLAMAAKEYEVHALTVSYGQLHTCEIQAAEWAVGVFGAASHKKFQLPLAEIAQSALTTHDIAVPKGRTLAQISAEDDVPPTYVPARNIVLLSLATSWADSLGAMDIFIGANVLDASGYPDCRPEFLRAYESAANLGTRAASGNLGRLRIHAPLIDMTKAQIIKTGIALGVDYSKTHSCYDPVGSRRACGSCDACILRRKGFEEAGVKDPTIYA